MTDYWINFESGINHFPNWINFDWGNETLENVWEYATYKCEYIIWKTEPCLDSV